MATSAVPARPAQLPASWGLLKNERSKTAPAAIVSGRAFGSMSANALHSLVEEKKPAAQSASTSEDSNQKARQSKRNPESTLISAATLRSLVEEKKLAAAQSASIFEDKDKKAKQSRKKYESTSQPGHDSVAQKAGKANNGEDGGMVSWLEGIFRRRTGNDGWSLASKSEFEARSWLVRRGPERLPYVADGYEHGKMHLKPMDTYLREQEATRENRHFRHR